MKHVTPLRAVVAAGAASLLAVGVVTAATAASAKPPPGRVDIAGTHPGWATAKALVSTNAVTTGTVAATVYLASQNRAGLAAYAKAVSTPGNPLYGHFLSPAQVAARFAPSAAQGRDVSSWLTSAGLTVTKVVSGIGGYVQVTGSAVAAAKAFSVTFGSYRLGTATVRAPEGTASAPASIASDIIAVTGLDTAKHMMKPADTLPPPPQNYFVAPQCSQYYGQYTATTVPGTSTKIPTAYGTAQPWTNCGYTPAQIRGAYYVGTSGETGKGATVAVVDAYASPTMQTDANQYAKATGDQAFRPGQYQQVLLGDTNGWTHTAANDCGASGWYGEESLDVESVHGMAPNANVTYVGAVSCYDNDLLAALAYIVRSHSADIVTNSWGEPYDDSNTQAAYDQVFQAGAAEGIGFFFSSGDSGYEDPSYEDPGYSDQIQVDYPTSSPWVTSVGGTSLAIGKSNNYEFETSWGTDLDPLAVSKKGVSSWSFSPPGSTSQERNWYDGSGGGGVSTAYMQPWYQKSVVPTSLATDVPEGSTKTPMRVVPDVSALADPSTGFLVGETLFGPNNSPEKFYLSRIGGTSVACPIFAGIEADAQQAHGHPIGFANPAVYALAGAGNNTKAFKDVTDHPLGPGYLAEVRANYTDPYNETLPLVTYLRTLGINGVGASALPAVPGYDDATGVGSPGYYIQAFGHASAGWRLLHR